MQNNILKRVEVLESINRTGRCNVKDADTHCTNLYRFVNKWSAIGLIEVKKIGRELDITLTPKGKKYLAYLTQLRDYSDFFY